MPITQSGAYAVPRIDLMEAVLEFPLNTDEQFVAEAVLPMTPVAKKAATFAAVTRASLTRTREVKRGVGSAANRDGFETRDIAYAIEEKSQEIPIDDNEAEKYASDFDAEIVSAALATDIIRRSREQRVASAIFNTTTFTGATLFTDVSGTPWTTAGTAITTHVETAKEQIRTNCGLYPNTMVIEASNIGACFRVNTTLIDAIKYTARPTAAEVLSALADYFGVRRVIVPKGVRNSADEGQTFAGASIWSNLYCWLGITADNGAMPGFPCIGRTLYWDAMQGSGEVLLDQYREEQTESNVIRAREWTTEKIFDANFGHLLKIR